MKRLLIGMNGLSALLLVAAGVVACNQAPESRPATPAVSAPATSAIERGRVLVNAGVCHDCHTPKKIGPKGPEPDMDRALSGHPETVKITAPAVLAQGSPWVAAGSNDFTAWSGPWGVSFAANLTPDTNTGLRSGVWTEALFIQALRTGKHMGTARDILPPMPWPNFAQFSDEDLKAIWAYLGTVRPINNHVPEPIPPVASPAN